MVGKKPNSKRNLDMAIRRLGGDNEGYVRRRTIIANAIVSSLMPDGVVKGGSALKIRFGDIETRSTTDLDAAHVSSLREFTQKFEDSLAEGWEGFEGRLIPIEPAHPHGVPEDYVMQPFEVKLSYRGSSWCTVSVELGHNEIGDAEKPDYLEPTDANEILVALGFPRLPAIPTMGLHYQIAQKLHGASAANSKRAHDLIDLQLIIARAKVDYSLTRKTCERLFAYRQQQQWPPTIVKGTDWETLYTAQANSDLVLPTVDEAIVWANDLIAEIDSARQLKG